MQFINDFVEIYRKSRAREYDQNVNFPQRYNNHYNVSAKRSFHASHSDFSRSPFSLLSSPFPFLFVYLSHSIKPTRVTRIEKLKNLHLIHLFHVESNK